MLNKKINLIYMAILFVLVLFTACNHDPEVATLAVKGQVSDTIKVWGNCEMCQETIEGSLKTKGIASASWNSETKMLAVSYDSTQIKLDQIHKLVAASGYDTEKYKADDESYKNLHECCQYERKE